MPENAPSPTVTWLDLAMLTAAGVVLAVAIWRGWLSARFTEVRLRRDLRPNPPPHWGLWLGVTALAILGFVSVNAAAQMVFAGAARPPWPLDVQAKVMLATMGVAVPLALFIPGLILRDVSPKPEADTLRIRAADVCLGAGWIVAVYPLLHATSMLCVFVYTTVLGRPPDAIAHSGLQTMVFERENPWAWGLAAAAVIGAPIFEEIVFRGLLQTSLVKATRSPRVGVVLTALLFAGAHVGSVQPFALAVLAVFAVCLGVLYERTGRLGACIGLHIAFNALQLTMAMVLIEPGASV